MEDFFIKNIVEPFLAILFCLVFGIPFTYVGFQRVDIEMRRDERDTVTLDMVRKHYLGLIQIDEHLEEVENATLKSNLYRRKSTRHFLGSGVYVETATDATPLLAGSSNVNDDVKWEMVRTINDFIQNPRTQTLDATFRINNLFGWFGLPFLILGILGLVGWPFSIIRQLKDR